MTIANCKRCNRIYQKVRRDICPDCITAEEGAFQEVRAYLRAHRDASMEDVTEGTGVSRDVIIDLIRAGRLILRDNPNLHYSCERCGAPTQAGRYCAKCSSEIAHELQGASRELREHRNAGMDKGKGFFSN